MGRYCVLLFDQVIQLIENKEKKSNKEWAEFFGVSLSTIHNAKKQIRGYANV